jgi:hypothetical protein
MFEVPPAGEDQGGAAGVDEIDGILILERAAGMDDGGDAGVKEQLRSVGEREKSVAGGDGAGHAISGFFDCDPSGAGTIHLSGAGTKQHSIFANDDGVALDVFADEPGELQVG